METKVANGSSPFGGQPHCETSRRSTYPTAGSVLRGVDGEKTQEERTSRKAESAGSLASVCSDSWEGLRSLSSGLDSSGTSGGVPVVDPGSIMSTMVSCGATPEEAMQLINRYYEIVNANKPSFVEHASVTSHRSQLRQQRMERWQAERSAMAEVPGQCYLRMIRWGRRKVYQRELGTNPSLQALGALLEFDDLDARTLDVVKFYKVSEPHSLKLRYHLAEQDEGGECVGTVRAVLSCLVRNYPMFFPALRIPLTDDSLDIMPVVGVVGSLESDVSCAMQELLPCRSTFWRRCAIQMARAYQRGEVDSRVQLLCVPSKNNTVGTMSHFVDDVFDLCAPSDGLVVLPIGARVDIGEVQSEGQTTLMLLVGRGTNFRVSFSGLAGIRGVLFWPFTAEQFADIWARECFHLERADCWVSMLKHVPNSTFRQVHGSHALFESNCMAKLRDDTYAYAVACDASVVLGKGIILLKKAAVYVIPDLQHRTFEMRSPRGRASLYVSQQRAVVRDAVGHWLAKDYSQYDRVAPQRIEYIGDDVILRHVQDVLSHHMSSVDRFRSMWLEEVTWLPVDDGRIPVAGVD